MMDVFHKDSEPSTARFKLDERNYFDISFDGDGILIRCMDGPMIIIPDVSNVIRLSIKDRFGE